MHGPLRYETTKYRRGKRHQLDGSVPGIEYPSFASSRRHVLPPMSGPGGFHDKLYNSRLPREYHPSLDAPAVQSDEYVTDPNWQSHHVPPSHEDRVLRPFPESEPTEPGFDYNHAKTMSAFFLKVMEAQYRPLAEGQEVPSVADICQEHFGGDEQDVPSNMSNTGMAIETAAELTPEDLMRKLINITGALGHLQKVFPEDHPDIVNLRGALHEILNDPEAMSKLESLAGDVGPSKLGTGDPYAIDPFEEAEQLFEQQTQSIESAFDEPMLDSTEPAASEMFEEQPEMMSGLEEASPEAESLEQIVEQEHVFGAAAFMEQDVMPNEMTADMDMSGAIPEPTGYDADSIADEINQAIDGVTQQAMPQEEEPDPFQPFQDPYTTAQQIFDEQMLYMDNPFMMPGMGPMPGM